MSNQLLKNLYKKVMPNFSKYFYWAFFIVIIGLNLLFILTLVLSPHDKFYHTLVIDDTLYYTIVANNFVHLHSFTFDGFNITNGFQPMWEIVCVGIAFIFRDKETQLRILVFLSEIFWTGSALNIFYIVKKYLKQQWIALVVLAGLILNTHLLYIFGYGMENGISAFILSLFFLWLLKVNFKRRLLSTNYIYIFIAGTFLALIGLARVDAFIFCFIFGSYCIAELAWEAKRIQIKPITKKILILALPVIILGGLYILSNIVIFNNFSPVSGTVKNFYEKSWLENGYPNGGFIGNLKLNYKYVYENTFQNIIYDGTYQLFRSTNIIISAQTASNWLLVSIIIGFIVGVYHIYKKEKEFLKIALLFTILAFVHLTVFAILLPHFTIYGLWYFSLEFLIFWMAFGIAIYGYGQLFWLITKTYHKQFIFKYLIIVFLFLQIIFSAKNFYRTNKFFDYRTKAFETAGIWLNTNIPANTRIGAFSSGYLSYFATHQSVTNLDGLINSQEYLDNYLRKGKFVNYINDQGLQIISDYSTYTGWGNGINWGGGHIPSSDLRVLKTWPLDKDTMYAILDLNKNSTRFQDIYSLINFDAKVNQKYTVVENKDIATIPSDKMILTSFINQDLSEPYHIVVNKSQAISFGITTENIDITNKKSQLVSKNLELIGFDINKTELRTNERFSLTRFWQVTGNTSLKGDEEIVLTLSDNKQYSVVLDSNKGQYNTHPVNTWVTGEIVRESYLHTIPAGIKPGEYSIYVSLRNNPKQKQLLTNVTINE